VSVCVFKFWQGLDFGCCKFYVHLRSLNVHHFGKVEGTGGCWCHLQWHDSLLFFINKLNISKVIRGGHVQTEWWSHKRNFF
jgi:hypothetical protein